MRGKMTVSIESQEAPLFKGGEVLGIGSMTVCFLRHYHIELGVHLK